MPHAAHDIMTYLRVASGAWRNDPRDDAALVSSFAETRDQSAFATLIWRHGAMVWRTCRRVLGETPDAEDAFQSAFLALSRKAGKFPVNSLAGWLHRVARQAALDTDVANRRRRGREQELQTVSQMTVEGDAGRKEIYAAVDEELAKLPERLRTPLILRYLEGKTLEDVAHVVGCSRRALGDRMAKGEKALRKQLERRGLALGAVPIAALLNETSGTLPVPGRLIDSTARAATAFRAGALTGASAEAAEKLLRSLSWKGAMGKSWWLMLGSFCVFGLGGAGLVAWNMYSSDSSMVAPLKPSPTKSVSEKPSKTNPVPRTDRYGDPLPEGALARFGTNRLRCGCEASNWLESLSFLPDGKTLVSTPCYSLSAIQPKTIRMWEASTGKLLRCFQGMPGAPFDRCVAISADGKMMASGLGKDETAGFLERNGWVCLVDMSTGKEIRRFHAHDGVVSNAAFSQDGKTLVTVGLDQIVRLWDVSTGKQLHQSNVQAQLSDANHRLNPIFFSPDVKSFVVWSFYDGPGTDRNLLRLWDVRTGKQCRTFENGVIFSGTDWHAAFTVDGKKLAARCLDGWVRVWDTASGKELYKLENSRENSGRSKGNAVVFSSDGSMLAAAGGEDNDRGTGWWIRVWELTTGRELRSWVNTQQQWSKIISLAFSPDSKRLAALGDFEAIQLWDVATGKPCVELEGHLNGVDAVAFAPSGESLASSAADAVLLWDVASSRLSHRLETSCNYKALAYSPDSKILATVGRDQKEVLLWDAANGEKIRTLMKGSNRDIQYLAFTQGGKTLAAGGGREKEFCLLDVNTDKQLRWLTVSEPLAEGKDHLLRSVVSSPDHRRIASVIADTIYVWDPSSVERLGSRLGSMTHIPSNAEPKEVFYWDINSISFSSDSRMVASGGDSDPNVRIWETASGFERLVIPVTMSQTYSKHEKIRVYVSFSPDGCLIASGGRDETIQLWDAFTGRLLHRFPKGQGSIESLAFAPDGRSLAAGYQDTTVLLWDVSPWSGKKSAVVALSKDELKESLTALADGYAVNAYKALRKLVEASDQSVPLLTEQLCSVPLADTERALKERMTRLLANLDNDNYQVRNQAQKELENMADAPEPFLRQALKGELSVEARQRVKELLVRFKADKNQWSPRQLFLLRSVEVLERIGTPAARQALQRVIETSARPEIRREAEVALKRLESNRSGVCPP